MKVSDFLSRNACDCEFVTDENAFDGNGREALVKQFQIAHMYVELQRVK
jgi:hypothetical protein